jgi:hypothetical protein
MRKISNGILYDTDKATALAEAYNRAEDETLTLYKSENGKFFFVSLSTGYHEEFRRLWPTTVEDIFVWLEQNRKTIGDDVCDELYLTEFSNYIQEA